ncbi:MULTISPECIES: phosphoglucosamine mutase [Megasphaera]|uniref:Phosphoglucosamine mutase n=1 Tax=Megasphaera hutchinsoni TaxID=1588748 RepID=A0A134CF33_9FIRM|nr:MULTISPECIES: phosphoglucosamine mutase [Megasphaera]EGS35604.1 phosphoglucosamine mutase [Megasphaera sp. UPII 135-E]KXB90816.1 phosphoglucosamine mutase [Megasphaera hutchinsoni]
MARLFGTDGVRGVVNDSLTPELAYHLGRAAAYILGREKEHPTFLIGRDTRRSGTMLESILAAGIASAGGNCYMTGVIPTPAIAYLTRVHHMDAGVMISASHNPFEYNGIKFFDAYGYKLPDKTEDLIEEFMLKDERTGIKSRPIGSDIGTITVWSDLQKEYADFLFKTCDVTLKGLKVVHDAANGSASFIGPVLFERLGAEVISIHHEPDGININEHCGSTDMESLRKKVLETGADIGIANDGDADRCLIIDEKGNTLDGDQIMLLCALRLQEEGKLNKQTVVGTVMSNIGFHKALQEHGCQSVVTAVGDRYVLERMRKDGYSIGGEQSGHIIFLEHNTTGDGLLTAVQVLRNMKHWHRPLSELGAMMVRYPQILKNVMVQTKSGWEKNNLIMAAISAGEEELGNDGRILVRPSGTEPLIRVMAEGPDLEQLQHIVDDIAVVIEHEMGHSK